MSTSKITEGKKGEEVAAVYLKQNGFTIIERNFRIRGGEIDIIALDSTNGSGQEVLVFIEVKTRTSSRYGTPLEAIGYWKLKSLVKTAQFYKMKNPKLPDAMRIDALGVQFGPNDQVVSIELVKNISEEYT